MKHLRPALIFGIITAISAVIFLVSPLGRYIEDEFGLALLFKVRGSLSPPGDVIIINIDEKSSEQLDLPKKIENWPRSVYADLVDALFDIGAAVIVFDIHFGDAQNEDNDQKFADSMQKAGNVILYQKMVRKVTSPPTHADLEAVIDIEQEIPPTGVLADAALASASFPIPKMPVRVNQAWTFKTSAGETPTLPLIALQALALDQYDAFYAYVRERTGGNMEGIPVSAVEATQQIGLIETMRRYRQLLSAVPKIVAHRSAEDQLFQALVNVYQGPNNIYINFYGPPATLKTHSLLELLSDNNADSESLHASLKGKVVFVGAARTTWSEQKDGFYTVFTQPNGLDLSGVEIAAAVYANLSHNNYLTTPSLWTNIALLMGSAIIFAVAAFSLNPAISVATLLGVSSCCFLTATRLFSIYAIRLPVITWIILLPPILFFSAIIYKLVMVRRERTHIKQALHMYLPDNVADEISRDLSFIKTGDRMVYGVCLSTDAQGYTTLSESLPPTELSALMKSYFEMMFNSVKRYDGVICNVVGDAMFALWPATDEQPTVKRKACRAAIDIVQTIEACNEDGAVHALPTRIGLHCGYLLMGHIGAEGHYEYAPVGDIVNTASRIENLNKQLGTWILASEDTIKDCRNIKTRHLGTFLMSGKSQPITLYQVLPNTVSVSRNQLLYEEAFPEALELFQSQKWEKAEKAFNRCVELQGVDGPSQFYLQLSSTYRQTPPDEAWYGVIPVKK